MDDIFYLPDDNHQVHYRYITFYNTEKTFEAYADAILPRMPELALEYGEVQYYGAIDFNTNEYIIFVLDFFTVPLADPVAMAINLATWNLIYESEDHKPRDYHIKPKNNIFESLAPKERLIAIEQLQERNTNLENLPDVFYQDPEVILFVTSSLTLTAYMGYYSEWFGYGTTRLDMPNQRVLEFYPLSWRQIGYPGPSLGYRALRTNTYL